MDTHLKKLENESIYIFRQAYRSINNIAMLWSLGKDSNVMVWLAFKAFLAKYHFRLYMLILKKNLRKCMNSGTGMKKEWNLNLIKGGCPPVSKIDPSLPPAARSAARKTEGLKKHFEKIWFQRSSRWN